MTVALKPCLKKTEALKPILKKPEAPKPILKAPLPDPNVYDEERHIEIRVPFGPEQKHYNRVGHMFILTLLTMLLVMITIGLLLYCNNTWTRISTRYHGYCSVPVEDGMEQSQIDFRMAPLFGPGVQMRNTYDKETTEKMEKFLNEQLEIGDDVEKIYVDSDNGKDSFIYDWKLNISGIISAARCFLLDMEPRLALSPQVFLTHISRNDPFTVSRVRSNLWARPVDSSNPTTLFPRDMANECDHRPLYMLTGMHSYMRKRSAEEAKPHFVHFAGKHLHEIEVTNMAELLAIEAKKAPNN